MESDAPPTAVETFDEIVYKFMSGSSTLSTQQRLEVLKQSAAGIQHLNDVLPEAERYERARSRAREAYKKESAARSGGRAAGHSRPQSRSASAARGGRPSLTLQHPETFPETARQLYSQRGDSTPTTPVKVLLGPENDPVVLHDYYPEPVRSRNRRPSYRERKLSQINLHLKGEQEQEAANNTSTASATTPKVKPLKMDSLVAPGADDDDNDHGGSKKTTPRTRRRRHTVYETPRTEGTLSTVVPGLGGARDGGGRSGSATPRARLRSQSFSGRSPRAGGRQRRASFLSKAYMDSTLSVYQDPHLSITSNGKPLPPNPAAAATPADNNNLSVTCLSLPPSAPYNPLIPDGTTSNNNNNNNNANTNTNSSALASGDADRSLSTNPDLSREHTLASLRLDTTLRSGGDGDSDAAEFMEPPLTGRPTTARTEAAYRRQRDQVLQLLQNEIDAIERQREERRRQLEEERRRKPRLVDELQDYPAIARNLELVAHNSQSAYNWSALAESMSEAQLLPPYCVSVTYVPQPDDGPLGQARGGDAAEAEAAAAGAPRTVTMNMVDMLVEAINNDFEHRNAWEGLALLLQPGEKVVVKKARTRRPLTVTHIDCYIQLLRIEPFFFYGWMGLGCAMLEEQHKMEQEAQAATEAMAAAGIDTVPGTPDKRGSAASTPKRGSAVKSKRRGSKLGTGSGGAVKDLNGTLLTLAGAVGGGSEMSPVAPVPLPPLTFPVLYGRRPYEAKDCFGRAAQICPWDGAIWAQLVTCMPDAGSTVEFDAPMDERELVELKEQQETMKAVNSVTAETFARLLGLSTAAAEALCERVFGLGERLAGGAVLSFAEVASVALELSPKSRDLWLYVGKRLRTAAPQTRMTPKISGPRPHATTVGGGGGSSVVNSNRTPRRRSTVHPGSLPAGSGGGGAAGAAGAEGTVVRVLGRSYTKDQCLKQAELLFNKQRKEKA